MPKCRQRQHFHLLCLTNEYFITGGRIFVNDVKNKETSIFIISKKSNLQNFLKLFILRAHKMRANEKFLNFFFKFNFFGRDEQVARVYLNTTGKRSFIKTGAGPAKTLLRKSWHNHSIIINNYLIFWLRTYYTNKTPIKEFLALSFVILPNVYKSNQPKTSQNKSNFFSFSTSERTDISQKSYKAWKCDINWCNV